VDIDVASTEALISAGLNCTPASFGSLTKLPLHRVGDAVQCRVKHDIPPNLHEYDIVVVDLSGRDPVDYDPSQHTPPAGNRASQWFMSCRFPQTLFDPAPVAARALSSLFREFHDKESVIVLFASSRVEATYYPIELTPRGYGIGDSFSCDNYSFMPSMPTSENKVGSETTVTQTAGRLREFLHKYNNQFTYSIVFRHPTDWTDGQHVEDPSFLPLVKSSIGEIISYADMHPPCLRLVFPQLEDKATFLLELLQAHLPAVTPNLFPFSTQFSWLDELEYLLPGEQRLRAERDALEEEHAQRVALVDSQIEEHRNRYGFLHDLLTGTGKTLVQALQRYFRWLGFDDVVNCDEAYPGRYEEDLQVPLAQGLLVVEVKGIGGTSRDSECSQIGKVRRRRERERGSFDVSALYVVNHQRYLPPESRTNPPFTDQQLTDARDDDRGLLTTYELFKLYFAIDGGFVTRQAARESLLQPGLVAFTPSASISIGSPLELHYGGTVGVFTLRDVTIRVNDELIVADAGRYRRLTVLSLQAQEEDVSEGSEGEIGIRLSAKIGKQSVLWQPSNSEQ
jgi:hypothetical protein